MFKDATMVGATLRSSCLGRLHSQVSKAESPGHI